MSTIVNSITGTLNQIWANGSPIVPQSGFVDLEFGTSPTFPNAVSITGTGNCTVPNLQINTDKNLWSTNPGSSGLGLQVNNTGNLSWGSLPTVSSTTWTPRLRVGYSSGTSDQFYVPNIYLQRNGNIVTLTIDIAQLISSAGSAYPLQLISSNPVWSLITFISTDLGTDSFIPAGYYPNNSFFSEADVGGTYYLGTLPMCLFPSGGGSPAFFNAVVSLYVVSAADGFYSLCITPGGTSFETSVPQYFGANSTLEYYIGATGAATTTGAIDQISSVTYTYLAS